MMNLEIEYPAEYPPIDNMVMEEEEDEAHGNALPHYGNPKTMNLNPLVLSNIQNSPYFKTKCAEITTFHEVVDEIYYKVQHLEPWERGSRNTAGNTGMCGGVRGVSAGGIVSSAFCLLYKLFLLKLTRKQVYALLNHGDSPYIRGVGFMYIRYTQPPHDFWHWYEPYLEDEEELDVKAGGGCPMKIGELCSQFMLKIDWYQTLFPRIPAPIQKTIEAKVKEWRDAKWSKLQAEREAEEAEQRERRERERILRETERQQQHRSPTPPPRKRSRSRERRSRRTPSPARERRYPTSSGRSDRHSSSRHNGSSRHHHHRSRSRDDRSGGGHRHHHGHKRSRSRERSHRRRSSRSASRDRYYNDARY